MSESTKEEAKTCNTQRVWSIKDLIIIKYLGKGSYSKVFLMKDILTEKMYAVKEVEESLMRKEEKLHQLKREREILKSINHLNIIKLYFSFKNEEKIHFGLQYMANGDLAKLLEVCGKLPFQLAQYYAAELLNALEYLRMNGIVHRDIKPENILLDGNYHLKITDFGTAKYMNRPPDENDRQEYGKTFVGSPEYVSPEVLLDNETNPLADAWALGCIIYKSLEGKSPFYQKTTLLMFNAILECKPVYPSHMNSAAKDICKKLLVRDPANRLGSGPNGYEEIKSHPFFKGIDFGNLLKKAPPMNKEMIEKLQKGLSIIKLDTQPLDNETIKELKSIREIKKKHKVLKQGIVEMKNGLFTYSERYLVLNETPRLVYFSTRTNDYRGDIILTESVSAIKRADINFDLITPREIYNFRGLTSEDASTWVEAINNSKGLLSY